MSDTPVLDPVMELANKRFQFASKSESDNRNKMKQDIEFYVSDQWDPRIRQQRQGEARPCLTVNRLPQFTRQITNGLRQNMPSVRTIPVNDSDEDVANIYTGMMRHIQESSQAGIAYANANNFQVICGLGFFRVITDYCDDESFDKEIKIERIENPLTVYIDPTAVKPDRSDAMYYFITDDIIKSEFEELYPGKQVVSDDNLTGDGDPQSQWKTGEQDLMRIAEYWTIEDGDKFTIYQLEDGSILEEVPEGFKEVNKREVTKRKVIRRMISAVEVLSEEDWDGIYIPIIPVIGEEIIVDGVRTIKGMVRDAQDPQRMYNYWVSAQTEMVALAPKAPYMAAVGQIEGLKAIWDNLNTANYSYIPYNPVVTGGIALPPPQRQNVEPPVQAMVQAMGQCADDLKSVTGIYDAALGARGNETSGRAINARKLQGDVSNYHYADNFSYSQLFLGRQLLDLIPKTYDTARIVRILNEDGSSEYKKINQPSGEKTMEGIEKIYDLNTGRYDVVVDTGPSFKTKRQEDSELMAQMAQGNPRLMEIAGDIIVRNMDLPGAQELSERIKKTLPPELQDVDPSQEIPIKVKQQMDQSAAMIEKLTQAVTTLQDERDNKLMEMESRERIELEKINAQITLKVMELEGAASQALLAAELKSVNERLNLLNVNEPVSAENMSPPQVAEPQAMLPQEQAPMAINEAAVA